MAHVSFYQSVSSSTSILVCIVLAVFNITGELKVFPFRCSLVQYINSVIRNEVVTARTGTLLRPRAKNGTRYVFYEGLRWVRQNIYLNCPSAKFAVYGQLEEGDSSLDDFYMVSVDSMHAYCPVLAPRPSRSCDPLMCRRGRSREVCDTEIPDEITSLCR